MFLVVSRFQHRNLQTLERPRATERLIETYSYCNIRFVLYQKQKDLKLGNNVSDVYVQPDTCPLVHAIPLADMHGGVTLFLTDKDTGFRISLCFYFEQN